jgi:hypothetical protein
MIGIESDLIDEAFEASATKLTTKEKENKWKSEKNSKMLD